MPIIGKKIDTTSANFGNMLENNCLIVDKTRMIKEFIEGKEVSLIVRPRRFGKTSNMFMLYYFFSAEVFGLPTKGLFDAFVIAQEENGAFLKQHQGQYPVIFITFKDTKEPSFESTVSQVRDLVQELYREHKQFMHSEHIDDDNRALFQQYIDGTVNEEQLQKSLKFLSAFLFKAHGGKRVIILIDEYDTPLTNAYQYHFLEPLSNFMRDMYSAALKDNPYLEKGLMTGILRISKSNMLSGLNNLEVYTLLDKQYSQYFGFTEDEIKELVHHTQNDANLNDIRSYYNGYNIGGTVIYNPWSTMKFLDRKELVPYWVLTSNDSLLKNVFLKSNDEIKTQLMALMQGESIIGDIDINLRYEDLMEKPSALWTLLLFCGYVTVESKTSEGILWSCQLKIPNREVLAQYTGIFKEWFKETLGHRYTSLLTSLTTGDVELFTKSLGNYLMHSLSIRDVHGTLSESFYHGFVAGLIGSIRDTHWVSSNGESGRGFYDVMLIPKNVTQSLAILIEFKQTKKMDALQLNAEKALTQINTTHYDAVLTGERYSHIQRVVMIGLAFCEKAVIAAHQIKNLKTDQPSTVALTKTYHHPAYEKESDDD